MLENPSGLSPAVVNVSFSSVTAPTSTPIPGPRSSSSSPGIKAMTSFFGILGGEKIIHNGPNLKALSGLELFGTEALVLGSGFKFGNNNLTNDAQWKNSLSLSNDFISASSYDNECQAFSNLHMNANSFALSVNNDNPSTSPKNVDGINLELNKKGKISLTESELALEFGKNKIIISEESIKITCNDKTFDLSQNMVSFFR
jgi:hypothetical protein